MYAGKIVEYGRKADLFQKPLHPYTNLLFSAVPDIHKPFLNESTLQSGEIPSPIDLPKDVSLRQDAHTRMKHV